VSNKWHDLGAVTLTLLFPYWSPLVTFHRRGPAISLLVHIMFCVCVHGGCSNLVNINIIYYKIKLDYFI